jgi:hypothetical protein
MDAALTGVLSRAGWGSKRCIDTTVWEQSLKEYGFSVSPAALNVLSEYGSLVVHPVPSDTDEHSSSTVIFEPLEEAEQDRIEYWEKRLNLALTPVGGTSGIALLVAENGEVYAEWSGIFWRVGSDIVDALENVLIFAKNKFEEVGRVDDE